MCGLALVPGNQTSAFSTMSNSAQEADVLVTYSKVLLGKEFISPWDTWWRKVLKRM